jgi:hypothetical protein
LSTPFFYNSRLLCCLLFPWGYMEKEKRKIMQNYK